MIIVVGVDSNRVEIYKKMEINKLHSLDFLDLVSSQ